MRTDCQVGPWSVREGVSTLFTGELVPVTVISDGEQEFVTTGPILELTMALMVHMGVGVISTSTPN